MQNGRRGTAFTPAIITLCLIELVTLGALLVPIFIGLPLAVTRIRPVTATWTNEQGLALVTSVGAFGAMVASPLFGWLTDRTRTASWGRTPWIVFGLLAGSVTMWQTAVAQDLRSLTLWWLATQVSFNAIFAAVFGSLSDVVRADDRSVASGWLSASVSATVIVALGVITFLPKTTFNLFGLAVVVSIPVVAIGVIALVRAVRMSTVFSPNQPGAEISNPASGPDEEPGWRGQFWLLVAQRVLAQLGYGFAVFFSVFFLVRRFGMAPATAATWAAATTSSSAVLGMLGAVFTGHWAVRLGRSTRPMRLGITLIVVGLAILAVASNVWLYVLALWLVGFGMGIYGAVDLALVLRAVPPNREGRYLGFFNVARTLPQTLAPALAPLLLAIGTDVVGVDRSQNFAAFYVAGIFAAAVSFVLIAKLRITSPNQEPLRSSV